ncbi:hypothetical protein AC578_9955 [Pseudocercospora eumusae]|uniref:Uncharacterized protein n=1 Tax=Pseudocercospora eumusae TaxID=321146 RepID=A0A139H087_9PEZI|nr:hypothetical protein AC578_9955 [Pseudocercospora eumusae]
MDNSSVFHNQLEPAANQSRNVVESGSMDRSLASNNYNSTGNFVGLYVHDASNHNVDFSSHAVLDFSSNADLDFDSAQAIPRTATSQSIPTYPLPTIPTLHFPFALMSQQTISLQPPRDRSSISQRHRYQYWQLPTPPTTIPSHPPTTTRYSTHMPLNGTPNQDRKQRHAVYQDVGD